MALRTTRNWSTCMPRRSLPSSSSSSVQTGPVPDRYRDEDDDGDEDRLLADLAGMGFRPDPWCRRYYGAEDVTRLLERPPLGIAIPDAIDLVNRHGVSACEGAAIRTLAHAKSGSVRKPSGLLIKTLRAGWAWTSEQVQQYVDHEWDKAVEDAG